MFPDGYPLKSFQAGGKIPFSAELNFSALGKAGIPENLKDRLFGYE
jgi:hypothetical protein